MGRSIFLFALVAIVAQASGENEEFARNPIRRVVTMLQSMQQKVMAEGKKETALFEKFMCFCKNSGGSLSASITAADAKLLQLGSDIAAAEAEKVQLDADLKAHRVDRTDAKASMAAATALRLKQAATFAKLKGDDNTNVDALTKAIAAIEKGMGAVFLQSQAAVVLRRLMVSTQNMLDADRQDVLSFLSAPNNDYSPRSGEIVGILKQMKDEFLGELADATAAEEAAIKSYQGLMAAKTKEVAALDKAIEDKLIRSGEVAVSIAQMKNDLGDTDEARLEDQKVLANMKGNCETKSKDWDLVVKTRAEELKALADTITVLNDDDSLELFKKRLPSPGSSFVQLAETMGLARTSALEEIQRAQRLSRPIRQQLDFIALALHGKKIGFDKVVVMIDNMVENLKNEQSNDDRKKEYCDVQFDALDDKKKGLERSVSDSEAAIDNANERIAALAAEIEALLAGIKALDGSVADATEQRKEEHADFNELMAEDTAAKELLGFAKNRLNKFYNPDQYVAAPKRELTAQERITVDMGGTVTTPAPGGIANTGITVLAQVSDHRDLYTPMHQENSGVIAMINLLIADLDKDMTAGETEEKDSQAEYAQMMQDSADKRASDSKSLTEKNIAKANMEAQLQRHTDAHAADSNELSATNEHINSLHGECDWLLQHFGARKSARAGEVDALGRAKAVLNGADYSLLQTRVRSLRSRQQ